ncbi:phage portal protein [Nocardioides pini]|uniref:phage portal protein n=1 Tax=Nocardioides pini TaxID=2975053 RepID=UPI00227BF033|nr:phage portal protein [Nocardioides pini]
MAYFNRDGDIIALDNEKAGSLTMSVPLMDYQTGGDPADLWATQPAVRTVTGEIAREVGSIPLHHYRRTSDTDRDRLTDTPVSQMMRMPAPGYGAARWFEQAMLDLAVHDRWAALITADASTGRWGLRRLPAHRVAIGLSGGVRVGVWYFPPNDSEPVLIPLDRVVFDVAPSAMPDDQGGTYRGSSRLRTLADLAIELNAVHEWRGQVLRNGARVPAVIERPVDAPKWDDAAFNRFKSGIDSYKRGGGNEGGFPILEDGMKLKPADVFNPKDFDTAGIRSLTLIEACLLYNYPPELLGAREGTYSNIESFREAKWVDVLGSWIVNLEQALNVGLLTAGLLGDDEYVEANVDAKLRGSFDAEAKAFASATGRPWMSTNEVRARKNLPAVEGGDDLVTPLNVIVGGVANPRDTAPDPVDRDDAPKARGAG